jgi:hypothetical protein
MNNECRLLARNSAFNIQSSKFAAILLLAERNENAMRLNSSFLLLDDIPVKLHCKPKEPSAMAAKQLEGIILNLR